MSPVQAAAAPNPLAAACYADRAWHGNVTVVENVALARDTYGVRLACPEIARRIVPGQFLMLRVPGVDDPLLGRPFALYDTWLDARGELAGLDVVYLAVGRMTRRLAMVRSTDMLKVWGPLGNGFSTKPVDRLVMVAGGIGQTPFLAVGREALGSRRYGGVERPVRYAQRATLCYGVRTADLLAGVDDFRAAGIEVRITSDDGSVGRKGFVTEELENVLADDDGANVRIACCGPERMMEAVAKLAKRRRVPCEVSLETPMACGIGACFSCVAKVAQPDGGWDYKRTCVDGPVFPAEKIVW